MASPTTVKPFHNQNGWTQFNNYILDYIMPECSPNAWKVLCFIIRKTEGWNKEKDHLSINQIIKGTGIKSKGTVIKTITELEENYYINKSTGNSITSNTYSLNLDFEIHLGSTKNELPRQSSSTKNELPSSTKNGLGVVQKMDTQKKGLKKPKKKTTTIAADDSAFIPDTDFGAACKCWEENIGVLSPVISDNIRNYVMECPPGWVERAINEGVVNNVRKWNYIKACLDNWLDAGQITDKPNQNGAKPNGPNRQVDNPTSETAERAQWLTEKFKQAGRGSA